MFTRVPNIVTGRSMIFTDVDEITEENILDVLLDAFSVHQKNSAQELYLFGYAAGEQPILEREKEIRPEINEKIVVNVANRIKNFKVGYEFSNPISYVQTIQNDGTDPKKDDERINALNDLMKQLNKASLDVELADSFKTCGLGYRLLLPDDEGLCKMAVLSPLCAFVVHKNDAFRQPVLGVSYSMADDGTLHIGAWSKRNYFEVIQSSMSVRGMIVKVYPWVYGEIPVIEYTNQRNILGKSFSCFEPVISILDAINTVNSDRANDIAQFVQSLLWFHNCDIDSEQKQALVDGNGLIVTKSTGDGREAKITYLAQTLDQSSTQSYIDYLKQEALEIVGVPIFGISTGGSTGTATSMSNGYSEADTRAQSAELEFERSEMRMLKLLLNIAKRAGHIIGDLKLSDIDIKFTRNKTYNLTDKVNSWATLLKNGADPLRATEIASFTTDTQAFTQDSMEMIKKIQESYASGDLSNDRIMPDQSDQKVNSPFVGTD